jgi:hypothetical protein
VAAQKSLPRKRWPSERASVQFDRGDRRVRFVRGRLNGIPRMDASKPEVSRHAGDFELHVRLRIRYLGDSRCRRLVRLRPLAAGVA